MKIQESAEDYLETILILGDGGDPVRSIDIAVKLGFSKPSVSVAMKKLRENGYISVDDNGLITLTEQGRDVACKVYDRHTFLTSWLISIGVSPDTARNDACRIEHVISEESLVKIKKFTEGKDNS
ncbi:MAG: metal-dependent transcriptional regulator [Oscillospiraceae bacterium]|jgi:Mn-dependent DtxR family transcriptional regulator|nr:metal-dependent transcriptional regulator [Oscillospiraceae bacterium]